MKTMHDLITQTAEERHPYELAKGWLRYEALRKLNVRKYAELCQRNLLNGERFDDMVDKLVEEAR